MTRITALAASRFLRGVAPLAALLLALVVCIAPTAAKDGGFTHGLLWRIEAAGAAPSWLFGTMHSSDAAIATPPPALQRILDGAASLTIELVMDEAANMAMARATLLPEGRLLGDIAGAERFRRIADTAARYGMPGDALHRFRPWALQMVFSLPPAEMQRQATGAPFLDKVLQTRAAERGIPVYGLETVEEQLAALAGASEEEQLVLLDAAMVLNPEIDIIFEDLKRLYLAQDLAGMYRMSEDMTGGAPRELVDAYTERLIQDRNRRMADRVAARLAEGNALIAVGALHLYGEDGVLGLLSARGYKVTRVE